MFLGRVLSQLAGLLFHPFLSATRWILWTDFGTERWKYRHQWKHKSKVMALFWNKHQCKRTEYVWLLKCYYEGQQKWYFLCTVLLSCDETPNGIRNNPSWNEWLFELSYLELTWTFGMGKGHYFSRAGNTSEIQFCIWAPSREWNCQRSLKSLIRSETIIVILTGRHQRTYNWLTYHKQCVEEGSVNQPRVIGKYFFGVSRNVNWINGHQ